MNDLICLVCGEPMDFHHFRTELTVQEQAAFAAGEGCDCCSWGRCPICYGTGTVGILRQMANDREGIASPTCTTCNGTGRRESAQSPGQALENLDAVYSGLQ